MSSVNNYMNGIYDNNISCRSWRKLKPVLQTRKNIEEEIEVRELACIIESFLDTLTIENRVIFMRRYWFSDSYKDIAEFVGLS